MYRKQQKGAALVVGLLVLLVVTLIGISSMSSTTTELKIANNLQTHNAAFQIAESAIRTVIDPENNTVVWDSANAQVFNNVHSRSQTDGSILEADIFVDYADCLTVLDNTSLRSSGDLTASGSGGQFKGIVQDATSVGKMLNSNGIQLAESGILIGKKTLAPGCPEN
jgi:type IV pilus assembly protein PilX